MINKLKSIGPAAFVTAAFIGPGTITTCSISGATHGYTLIWAILFSVIATLVLQEMSARLGLAGKIGLGEALRKEFSTPLGRIVSAVLVISAIAIGNAAYETGNILGGAMGLAVITKVESVRVFSYDVAVWGPVIGIIAFIMLFIGKYRIIERSLIGLVIIMSITFVLTAIIVKPDVVAIIKGLLIPRIDSGSIMVVIGLIGTTVVPYNLFLHASAVAERWKDSSDITKVRLDSAVSISLGGLISMAIVITSAAAFHMSNINITGAGDMAVQLEPLLGRASSGFLSAGLLAAGISSAITAPLAAAYATAGILGWKPDLRSSRFRSVWISILVIGTILSAVGFKPVNAIFFAQIANGILLPLVSVFLLRVMNNISILGEYTNTTYRNIIGIIVVLISLILGLRSIASVTGLI